MKSRVFVGLLVAGGLAATASAQPPQPAPGAAPPAPPAGARPPGLPPPERIERITENTYKIFGGGGNTLVFLQRDGVMLVDTKMPGNGQAILERLRRLPTSRSP